MGDMEQLLDAIRRENLRTVIDELGSAAKLARALGVSAAVVSQWVNASPDSKTKKPRGISHQSCRRIERAAAKPAGWMDEQHSPAGRAQEMIHARRIVSWPKLAWETLMTADLSEPFELDVVDDALGPDIFRGCVVRLDPRRQPEAGRPILVRDRAGRFYLRDYQLGAAGRWQAVARQRGFAPLDSEADGLEIVAVMRGFDWP